NWGSTPLVTTLIGSTLMAAIPASLVATAGSVSLTVTTAGGTSAPVAYTIHPPLPNITSLSPSSAAAGGARFTLTINGTGFAPNSIVFFGKCCNMATTYVSATQLTVAVYASLTATAGVADV